MLLPSLMRLLPLTADVLATSGQFLGVSKKRKRDCLQAHNCLPLLTVVPSSSSWKRLVHEELRVSLHSKYQMHSTNHLPKTVMEALGKDSESSRVTDQRIASELRR